MVAALPAMADNVTISGNVTFASLDGSSLDHDHLANGTFTVDDGDLTVLGTINCNDDGPGNNNACAMKFAVSGNFTMAPGSALFAENRHGGGTGGNITVNAGGNVVLQGATVSQAGAIISSASDSSNDNGGNVTTTSGGVTRLESGSLVSSGSKGGTAGTISVSGSGPVDARGFVFAGAGRNNDGGSGQQKGGNITIASSTHSEPAVTVTGTALIVSAGENNGAGVVRIEGCGLDVRGVITSISKKGTGNRVALRSGTTITIDSRDLGTSNAPLARYAALLVSDTNDDSTGDRIDVFARDGVTIFGAPTSLPVYSLNNLAKDDAGPINIISLNGGVTASGNAAKAGDPGSGKGGAISISAKANVVLNTAVLRASGKTGTKGGSISVRSHSGSVTWQNGTGDVRPVGSAVPASTWGSITLTYCTTVSTSGSSFPTNGAPVGTFPATAQTCSPASPSLPAGEPALPNCNDAPIAVNDVYTVAEGGTLNVPAPGVLTNDTDPDGDPITAILVSGPAHASSFALNANGSFTYVHDGSETTSDSFTYKANDGSLDSNVATVNITITPVNDPPVANDDNYSVAEGGTLNVAAPGVKANDTDPDGPVGVVTLVTGPAHASSFTLNPDGSFTYVHDGSETTSDSFVYQLSDGSLNSTATVHITITAVNDAPVAVNDAYSVDEGGTLNVAAPGVLGNDTDADGPSIHAVLVSGPAHASSFTLNANGSFTYVHNGSETTSDSFTYKANDGSLDSNVATVNITINPVNDAPVANNDGPYNVNEGGTLTVAAPGVLGNDTDADSPTLTAILVSGPAHASSFTLNPNGSFTYVHDGSETTSDSFTYKANDGSLDSNVATVSITITPVNDAPVAVNDGPYNVSEGGTLNVAAPGVLGNDTDADSPTLTAILVSGPAHASSFTLNPNGSFTYVHDGTETTTDTFTYKANDGSLDSNVATVTITIAPVDDAPVAVNDGPYGVNEGGTLNVAAPGVLGNDTDVDSPTLTAILVSGPAHATSFTLNPNGSFTYVHDGSETTTDTFTYKANDGTLDSNVATVSITITPVNDAPVAVNDAYSVNEGDSLTVSAPGVLGNDTDAENNALTAVLVTGPAHASSFTLNPDGSFVYVHDGSETTTDSFTYRANDGTSLSNIATVTITINPVNDAPVANPNTYSVSFHQTLNVAAPGVLGNDTDVDGPPPLTAVLVTGPTQGTFALNADGSFTYTHTGPTLGTDSFTYRAQDGAGALSNITTVTINIINQPPVANPDAFAAIGNTELRVGTGPTVTPALVTAGSVLTNDTDSDGPSPLLVSAFDAVSLQGGSVSMNPNGTFNYLPPVGFNGIDSFNYTITDGQATAMSTVTITVSNRVWYVNAAAVGAQSGRSTEPFATLSQAQSASLVNDTIHVAQGTYATGITLKNGQRLIGSGVPLTVGANTLAPATVRPVMGTVTLASGNLVTGLNVNVTAASAGITGSNINGGTIAQVDVTGGFEALTLVAATGTFNVTDVRLTPSGAGLTISGGSPTISASNLDVITTTGVGISGNAGTLNISAGADGSTVASTTGTAVDLSGMSLNVSLLSVSANGGTRGIRLNNTTGSFTVTGSGAAGSGGTIQNTSARGAQFTNTGSVSLSSMNFTNAATVNGDTPATCGDTLNGTNLNCNAAIHAAGVSGLSLSGVVVAGSAQIGINGNGVSNLTMNNVQVTNAGNEVFEHGVQFVNLSGTSSITGSTFQNNFYRQFTVQNSTGTLALNVTGSTFSSNGLASGAQGALISGHGTANMTVNVQTSTFTNNFGAGYFSDGADTAALDITVNTSTISGNQGGGINLAEATGSSLTYVVDGNTATGNIGPAVNIFKAALSTGTVSGKVLNNIIGTTGVPNSACGAASCEAISLSSNGTGGYVSLVSGNTVRNFRTRAVGAAMAESVVANLAITLNTIAEPAVGVTNAIFVQSGSLSGHTTSVCADINTNAISGTYSAQGAILVRNRFPTTTFRLPGYAGPGNSTAAVAAFLSGQNGGVTAVATISGNTFGGGAACVAP
jgi:VCBS repeat-containing protein